MQLTKYIFAISCVFLTPIAFAHHMEIIVSLDDNNQMIISESPQNIHLEPMEGGFWQSEIICLESDFNLFNIEIQPEWSMTLTAQLPEGLVVLDQNTQLILSSSTNEYLFSSLPVWDDTNGWHFHEHIMFASNSLNPSDDINTIITIKDSLNNYAQTEPATLNLHTVPEPATSFFMFLAGVILRKRTTL